MGVRSNGSLTSFNGGALVVVAAGVIVSGGPVVGNVRHVGLSGQAEPENI